MYKLKTAVAAALWVVVYIALVGAITWLSYRFTQWAVPAANLALPLGFNIFWQQIIHIVVGFPLFLYGALLVQRTTALNHTAQDKQTRKPVTLLTKGVYAVRRHPMYTGFICLQAGLWFSTCSLIGYGIGGVIVFVVSMNSKIEETGELDKLFPGEYESYKQAVPRRIYTPVLLCYLLLILALAITSIFFIIFKDMP